MMSHSFDPFRFYERKACTPLFFSGRLHPQKGIRHMTSEFDECEVDLDMQMSFLKAASRLRRKECVLCFELHGPYVVVSENPYFGSVR